MSLQFDLAAVIGTAVLLLLGAMTWMGKGIIKHVLQDLKDLKSEVKKLGDESKSNQSTLDRAVSDNRLLHTRWNQMLRAFLKIDRLMVEKFGRSFLDDVLPLDSEL